MATGGIKKAHRCLGASLPCSNPCMCTALTHLHQLYPSHHSLQMMICTLSQTPTQVQWEQAASPTAHISPDLRSRMHLV